jgi:type VI secretion system secreted protein VgrG
MDAQRTGPVTIETPLGANLIFHSMGGVEAMSRPFVFELTLVSPRADIQPKELLGQAVTVHLELANDSGASRAWHGIVSAVQYVDTDARGMSSYRLTLRPWLWQLGLAADCRIYQNLTVPEIVKQVFERRAFADFDLDLFEEYGRRDYVVQYRETDLHFVERLLEEVGIYYYFRHQTGRHTLVLTDSPHAHGPIAGYESIRYVPPDVHRDETMQYVGAWRAEGQLATGAYAAVDYDFTRPRVPLAASAAESLEDVESPLEVYDHPGGFLTIEGASATTRLRLGQLRRHARGARGDSNARGLAVGATFELKDHPRDDQNGKYLVVWTRVRLRGNDLATGNGEEEQPFTCAFGAIDAGRTFRPPASTDKPFVHGPQTATVVGPAGQQIWTDRYGRVKVQFHWDRQGKNDENSSCWVRVSQAWAGAGWGAQFIPRIGQEVVVDFLEGDPDRPLVRGAVYNGSNLPPFELPTEQTQSGIRTRSTPRGGVMNGNEIRFDDMKGSEDLFVQAEKTQTTIVKDAQTIEIGSNRTLTVGAIEVTDIGLTRSLSVGTTSATTIGGAATEAIGGMRTLTVGGQNVENFGRGSAVTVGGDSVTSIGGVARFELADRLRVMAGGDESRTTSGKLEVRVGDVASYTYAAQAKNVVGHPDREATQDTFVYGTSSQLVTKAIRIESETSITLQCGNTQLVITPDGVTVDGKTLALAAGSKLTVTSPNAALALDDNVVATGKNVTLSSSGAQLTLDSNAQLLGAQVKLGSGSGQTVSASADDKKKSDPGPPVYIRVTVLRNGKPAPGVSYKIVLDGATTLNGATTGAGLVEQKVPSTTASAVLTLLDTDETRTFTIGALDPPTTTLGAQQRLARLGFYHGPLDGDDSELLRHAVEMFQRAQGLSASGVVDGATRDAIKQKYGS